ncbi:PAAR-like domain-containing protein [Saccharospirillum salsuginis]|uniref:LysM domain-containing protein n=1 Tax=Saccharospirillum salsuginis TaxID=418750 RepID=A0A918JZ28_9GAMM|nr:PAAR-like domain-containing protein [Saccharospirillum salsuginis]GGX38645.1 hypothetical protein GCM10007392_01060 [Saccharospirillum salsuginis]
MSFLINGRSAVHKDSNGKLMTIDVCLTQVGPPVVPIPYLNVAESKDADNTADTVTVDGNPACNQDSTFAKSRGDEPGDKKGVRSGKTGAEASFIMGSPTVGILGRPAVRAMELMVSNAKNTPPSALLQSIGMPPLPASASSPEALEALEGPHWNAVDHQMPEGLHPQNFIGDMEKPEGPAIRQVASPTTTGPCYVAGIQPERSSLALGVREATPWPHKTEGYMLLPLGEYDHVLMEEPIADGEGAVELAYFKLRRFLTGDLDAEQIDALRPGWLYVYLNGYLWRELKVTEHGTFSDVDLRTWQGCDGGLDNQGRPIGRRATGTAQNYVELPTKINNEAPEIQVAFSEVQWSWKRIVSLGGMDPEDPRLRHLVREDETLSGIAECYPTVADSQHMADLNGLADPNAIQVDQVLTVREADQPPADAETLRQERMGNPIDVDTATGNDFTITLEDPLGTAELLANTMSGLMLTHQKIVGCLNGEHLKDTAADIDNPLVRDYFWYSRQSGKEGEPVFPSIPPLRQPGENWRKHCQYLTETAMLVYPTLLDNEKLDQLDEETREHLQTAAGELDEATLKDWLHVEERKAIRQDIRFVRDALTDVLRENTGHSLCLYRALQDYALQPTERYLDLWVRANEFLTKLIIDPCNLDQQYDLAAEVEKERSEDENNPGYDFLLDLLDPQGDTVLEQWHASLFPCEDQVDIFNEEAPELDSVPDPFDEDPYTTAFRPKDFARSIELADEEHSALSIGTVNNGADRTFKVIDRSLEMANILQQRLPKQNKVRLTLEPIFRLVKGAKIPVMENMRLVLKDENMTGLVAAGTYRIQKIIDVEHQKRLDHNERTKQAVSEARIHNRGGTALTKIVNSEGRVIGSDFISANAPYKGIPNPDIDKTDAKELFTTYGKTGTGEQLVKARMTVLALPEERYRRIVTRLDEVQTRAKESIPYRILPSGLFLLEALNFTSKIEKVLSKEKKDRNTSDILGTALGSGIKFIAAGIDAIEAWKGGHKAFYNSLKNSKHIPLQWGAKKISIPLRGQESKVFKIPAYKLLGIAGVAVDLVYSAQDTYTAIRRNDLDAATATAISGLLMAGSGVLFTIGVLPVLGWLLLIGAVIGFLIASWLTDEPLESWATNGPFAKIPENRLTGDDLNGNAMNTAEKALQQLQNILLAPSVKNIRKSPIHDQDKGFHYVEVEVLVPGYNSDASEFPMQMDVTYMRAYRPSLGYGPTPTTYSTAYHSDKHIEDLRADEIEPVSADENQPFRLKVYYKQKSLSNNSDKYHWQFRIKHHINANFSLPLPNPSDEGNPDNGWLVHHGATKP